MSTGQAIVELVEVTMANTSTEQKSLVCTVRKVVFDGMSTYIMIIACILLM